ncbi:hypothetical protein GCM10009865_27820 [Aeromicrobium ponti]
MHGQKLQNSMRNKYRAKDLPAEYGIFKKSYNWPAAFDLKNCLEAFCYCLIKKRV